MGTRTDRLQVQIGVDGDGQARASLANVESGLRGVGKAGTESKAELGALGDAVKELASGFTIAEGAKWLVEQIATAQALAVQLKAVTGSQQEFNDAQEIAKAIAHETANSADHATKAYIALRERGLAPSLETMRNLANIAAASGKSIDEVAGAVGSALTGQVRGLQELGIHIEEQNGKLVATFRGVRETIGSTAEDVLAYLEKIGKVQYAGAAAEQASTLAGQWAQLKQAASDVAEEIGESGLLRDLTDFVRTTRQEGEAIAHLFDSIGETVEKLRGRARGTWEEFAALTGQNARPDFSNVTSGPNFSNVSGGAASVNDETAALGKDTEATTRNTLAKNSLVQAQKAAADATQNAIDALRKQAISLTAGEADTVRYTAAQAAAKAGSKAQADQILKLGDAVATIIERRKAEAAALKQLNDRQDAYNEGVQQTRSAIEAEEKITKDLADAYKKVEDVIDPAGESIRRMQEDLDKLKAAQDAARQAGVLGTDQLKAQADAVDALEKKIESMKGLAALADKLGGLTGDKDSAASELDSMLTNAAATFTKALKAGFKDAGTDFSDLLDGIADQIINDIIKNKIVKNLANAAQGGSLNSGALQEGVGSAVGVYVGTYAGGGDQGAQTGAEVGTVIGGIVGTIFPVIGTAIGAAVGGILGGLVGGLFDGDGTAKVYSGVNSNSSTGGIDAFGRVQAYTNGLGDGAEQQLLQALMSLDNTMAGLLTADEVDKVKTALTDHVSQASTPDEALADRLNVIIAAVEPRWVQFLNKFEDTQSKAQAFASLRGLETGLKNFDAIIGGIGDPLTQLTAQVKALDTQVNTTASSLADAIASQDPTKIEQASAAAIQAVVNRYNTEIQLAQQLDAALQAAKQQAYQLNLSIAQHIAGITGDSGGVQGLMLGHIGDLQSRIPGESADQGLGDLGDYVGTVDNWLQGATQGVQQWLQQQMAGLQQQESELEAWASAENARRQQAAAQANAAAQAAHQRAIQALQQQLQLADQWVQLLDHAKSLQDSMTFGESNPLGGFGQLDALNQAIAALMPAGPGDLSGLTANNADQLLSLLQQRMQLIQSQDLYQRPSGDYVDQYNQTLQLISEVEGLAKPGVNQSIALQQQIVALQQQTVQQVGASSVDISGKLKEIHDAEDKVRQEAQDKQDALNKQALDYYTWAQNEAQQLEDAREKQLYDELQALTGGLPVQDFIAQEQGKATDLLTDIRDDIRDFLNAISGGNAGAGSGDGGAVGGGAGGGGGGGAVHAQSAPAPVHTGEVNVVVHINGSGLTPDDVIRTFHAEVRNAATDIRRILQVA